jgi:hypothetical protein
MTLPNLNEYIHLASESGHIKSCLLCLTLFDASEPWILLENTPSEVPNVIISYGICLQCSGYANETV